MSRHSPRSATAAGAQARSVPGPRGNTAPGGRRRTGPVRSGTATEPAQDKRRLILDAAVRAFARQGFFGAKVSEIADEAGVADGTIYLYFKSKDDLLISLFEDRMDTVLSRMRAVLDTADSAVDRLRAFVRLHLEMVEESPDMAEVVTVELRQSTKFVKEYANPKFAEFLRLIARTVTEGQQAGELRTDLDPQLVARTLFGALDEIALAWLVRGHGKMDLHRAADQLCLMFLDGLRQRT